MPLSPSEIKCAGHMCSGYVTGLICTDHGELCSECGIPTSHYRDDRRCGRCGAKADGKTCKECGSPWVYLTFHEDQEWRCKNCVANIIVDRKYDKAAELDIKAMEASRRILQEFQEIQEANKAKELEAIRAKRAAKIERKNSKPEDNLFTLESSKKKKGKK